MTKAGRNLEGGLWITADRSPTGTDRLKRWGNGASPFRGSLAEICPPREIIKEMLKGRQGGLGTATYRRVKNKSVSGIWSPKWPSWLSLGAGFYGTAPSWFLFTSLMARGGLCFFAFVAVLQSFVPTSFLLTLSRAHPTSLQVTVPAGHGPHTPGHTHPELSQLLCCSTGR